MPKLSRLAARATVFDAARSAVPLTLPSHATILTGMLPQHHGVHENGLDRLASDRETLATRVKAGGYRTAAFVGAFVLDRRFGLARGFDEYDDRIARDPSAPDRLEAERPANLVVDRALAWLSGAAPQHPAPFFVWIHLYDPHAPYRPPADYASRAGGPYDGELMFVDDQLARIWRWLDDRQLAASTIVIVAGDHGEGLGDHGERTHGMLLYDSTLRVPLLVAAPGRAAVHRSDAVTLADIAPTVLRLAGLAPPSGIDGRDLFDAAANRTLYSETDYPRVAGWSALRALTDGRFVAIRSDASLELYDVESDPAERRDLAAAQASTAAAMAARLDAIASQSSSPRSRDVSAETAERLRSLGYVTGRTQPAASGSTPGPSQHIDDWNTFEDTLANPGARDRVAALRRLARAHPKAMLFTTMLARAAKENGDVDGALATCRDAARRWPEDPTVLHDLGVAAADAASIASGKAVAALIDEASRAERAALVRQPDYAAAHNALGLLAANAGNDADSVRAFGRATELDPTNASYWTNLGNARRAADDAAGAEAAYRRALELDSRESDAANGIGALLAASGRAADAATWFERALAADPASVDARLNLGIARQQVGDRARAAAEYRTVLKAPAKYARQRDAAHKLLASLEATP